jgi:mitochondrial fission protein ELM1
MSLGGFRTLILAVTTCGKYSEDSSELKINPALQTRCYECLCLRRHDALHCLIRMLWGLITWLGSETPN